VAVLPGTIDRTRTPFVFTSFRRQLTNAFKAACVTACVPRPAVFAARMILEFTKRTWPRLIFKAGKAAWVRA
jgi:hypothetical protein